MEYTLQCKNETQQAGTFCVFQTSSALGVPNAKPLVWLIKYAAPKVTVKFSWKTDYCFAWAHNQRLSAGNVFWPKEIVNIGKDLKKEICFDKAEELYLFETPQESYTGNGLNILNSLNVQTNECAVAIGMHGSPAFAVDAVPNTRFMFNPEVRYWLTFGNFRKGEVLDAEALLQHAHELNFAKAKKEKLSVTLNKDNSWSEKQTKRGILRSALLHV